MKTKQELLDYIEEELIDLEDSIESLENTVSLISTYFKDLRGL